MTRVAFVCDWGESSASILDRYRRQTPGNRGVWKSVVGVESHKDCDLVVVLGGTELEIDKSKALLIHREPDFIRKPNTQGYEFYITWQDAFCGVTWWLSSTYDELMSLKYPKKSRDISCIASGKHAHRNAFVENLILKRSFFPWGQRSVVDLYGRGLDKEVFEDVYRGPIEANGNCKLDGLLPYRYSIVLENSEQKNYWTEKLADAVLAWCFPVYLGCPNIDDFFDNSVVNVIDGATRYRHLEKIMRQPISEKRIKSLEAMRYKILNEYNIWAVISNKVVSI